MLVDVIGSRVFKKVSEFKNFPFYINNFSIDQSIITLSSKPIPTSMKELDTTDLSEITSAYRDLNKSIWDKLLNSKSEILILDLLGELRSVSKFEGSYYSSLSLSLLKNIDDEKLTKIQQFRYLLELLNSDFIEFLKSYEKVFILKIKPNRIEEEEFLNGIYNIIESKLSNHIIINVPTLKIPNIFNAPLEFYHDINQLLKKYLSDSYEKQLLFNEKLDGNRLSVFINYLSTREYTYDLLKNGETVQSSERTTSRSYHFDLKNQGKYRIRVNLTDESIKPRLSNIYEYNPNNQSKIYRYIELPETQNLWMVDIISRNMEIEGFVGSPYIYPYGYKSLPVYHSTEMSQPFLRSDQIFSLTLQNIKNMDHVSFTQLIKNFENNKDHSMVDFINFLRTQR